MQNSGNPYVNALVVNLSNRFLPEELRCIEGNILRNPHFHEVLKQVNESDTSPAATSKMGKNKTKKKKLGTNIKEFLKQFPDGIPVEKFNNYYHQYTGTHLDPKDYQHGDIVDLLSSMNDVVCLKEDKYSVIVLLSDVSDSSNSQSGGLAMNSVSTRVPKRMLKTFKLIVNNLGGGVSIDQLIPEYEMRTGDNINLEKMGYSSIFELVSDLSGEFTIKNVNGNQHYICTKNFAQGSTKLSMTSIVADESESKESLASESFSLLCRRINEVLDDFPNDLSVEELAGAYKAFFGVDPKELNPQLYGFEDLESLLRKSELFCVKREKGEVIITAKSFFAEGDNPNSTASLRCVSANATYAVIDPQKLVQVGDFVEVVVAEVYSPYKFWVIKRDKEHSELLDELMDKMGEFYTSKISDRYEIKNPTTLVIGSPIASLYTDGSYYRAMYMTMQDMRLAKIFYVDFGTETSVPVSSLRYLHERFFSLPAQAIRCSLFGIVPLFNKPWMKSTTEHFLNLVRDKGFQALVNIIQPNGYLQIAIFDTSGNRDININLELVKLNMAELKDESDPFILEMKKHLSNNVRRDSPKPSPAKSVCREPGKRLSKPKTPTPSQSSSSQEGSRSRESSTSKYYNAGRKTSATSLRYPPKELRKPKKFPSNIMSDFTENVSTRNLTDITEQLNSFSFASLEGGAAAVRVKKESTSSFSDYSLNEKESLLTNEATDYPLHTSESQSELDVSSKGSSDDLNITLLNKFEKSKEFAYAFGESEDPREVCLNPSSQDATLGDLKMTVPESHIAKGFPQNSRSGSQMFFSDDESLSDGKEEPAAAALKMTVRDIVLDSKAIAHLITIDDELYVPVPELDLLMDKETLQSMMIEMMQGASSGPSSLKINFSDHSNIYLALALNNVDYLKSGDNENFPELNLLPLSRICECKVITDRAHNLPHFRDFLFRGVQPKYMPSEKDSSFKSHDRTKHECSNSDKPPSTADRPPSTADESNLNVAANAFEVKNIPKVEESFRNRDCEKDNLNCSSISQSKEEKSQEVNCVQGEMSSNITSCDSAGAPNEDSKLLEPCPDLLNDVDDIKFKQNLSLLNKVLSAVSLCAQDFIEKHPNNKPCVEFNKELNRCQTKLKEFFEEAGINIDSIECSPKQNINIKSANSLKKSESNSAANASKKPQITYNSTVPSPYPLNTEGHAQDPVISQPLNIYNSIPNSTGCYYPMYECQPPIQPYAANSCPSDQSWNQFVPYPVGNQNVPCPPGFNNFSQPSNYYGMPPALGPPCLNQQPNLPYNLPPTTFYPGPNGMNNSTYH